MIYRFKYQDTTYETESNKDLEQFVFQWIDNNEAAFMEYSNNKLGYISKDNYEAAVESFFEETIEEEEPLLCNLRS